MDREQVAALLAGAEGHVSGEEMSRKLGVTRAAVWKEIDALRRAGWPIESSTRKGYRLSGPPPALSGPSSMAPAKRCRLWKRSLLISTDRFAG